MSMTAPSMAHICRSSALDATSHRLPSMARVRPWLYLVAFLAIVPITTTSAEEATRPASTNAGSTGSETPDAAPANAIPTLEDITIEGEIVVPQVLFITARDRRRYGDYAYAAYLTSSTELARETVLPAWIGPAPAPITVRLTPTREAATSAPAIDE
jgi:hypothetical protein